jgi:metal-responsive CopG/Arc/MetJ family transcriptional regulator
MAKDKGSETDPGTARFSISIPATLNEDIETVCYLYRIKSKAEFARSAFEREIARLRQEAPKREPK